MKSENPEVSHHLCCDGCSPEPWHSVTCDFCYSPKHKVRIRLDYRLRLDLIIDGDFKDSITLTLTLWKELISTVLSLNSTCLRSVFAVVINGVIFVIFRGQTE